ncbi:MAG: hypothetical protein IT355_18935 [Gemmatimonadaceae bacterium]|nr:hypothetical protein [Gemmatimonadaceae bacterium]
MSENTQHRMGGLLLVVLSLAVAWWGIWQPYQAALAHQPDVRFHLKVFVLVPAAFAFGLFFILFGNTMPYRNTAKGTFTIAGWVLMLVVTAVAFGTYSWLKAQFAGLGYR